MAALWRELFTGRIPSRGKDKLSSITSNLASEPQLNMLGQVLEQISAQLQIRQAALFLTDEQGDWKNAHQLRTEKSKGIILSFKSIAFQPKLAYRHQPGEDRNHPFFKEYPWAYYFVPLIIDTKMVELFVWDRQFQMGT